MKLRALLFTLALLGCSNGHEPANFDVGGNWEAEGWVADDVACGFFLSDIALTGTSDRYAGSAMLTRPGMSQTAAVLITGVRDSVRIGQLRLATTRRSGSLLTGDFVCGTHRGDWSMYRRD